MGYLSRSALARESRRTLHEIDKLLTLGLPHQVIGSGRGSEVRVDRLEVLTWLVGLALSTASTESDDDAPEVVKQRARLFRLQGDSQGLKNVVARGELLPAEDVVAGWQATVGRSRALMLGMPITVAPQLAMLARQHGDDAEALERAARDAMTRALDAALLELSNPGFPRWARSARPKAAGILGKASIPPFTRRVHRDSTAQFTVTA